jgi:hypothetical protein
VLLLARLPWLERLVGFDRLSVWHRWNGHATLDLVLAHVVLSVWGYSLMDKVSLPKEVSTMLGGGIYPGMITATVGTFLLVAAVVSSVVIVKRRLRYEACTPPGSRSFALKPRQLADSWPLVRTMLGRGAGHRRPQIGRKRVDWKFGVCENDLRICAFGSQK